MPSIESNPVDVYPVHMLDRSKGAQRIMMRWDADKLRRALTTVLETGDWRKLAGRFHYTVREQAHGTKKGKKTVKKNKRMREKKYLL